VSECNVSHVLVFMLFPCFHRVIVASSPRVANSVFLMLSYLCKTRRFSCMFAYGRVHLNGARFATDELSYICKVYRC
jgi:hypothetical protein